MKRIALLLLALTLAACELAPAQVFVSGDQVRVIAGISCVNVRGTLDNAAPIIGCKPPGMTGTVRSASTWGGLPYYTVAFADGMTGWAAGKFLEKTGSTPPVDPPPIGTLSVSKRSLNGYVSVWYTAQGEDSATISGYPRTGIISGDLTFYIPRDTVIEMGLFKAGRKITYMASTVTGTTAPAPAGCDSTLFISRGFALARAKYDSVFNAGKASVQVDSLAIKLRELLRPFLK